AFGRRAEEHVPVEIGRRWTVCRLAEARQDVAIGLHPHRDDFANVAILDQLFRASVMWAGALLRADLDDALVLFCDVDHPAAFAGKERKWFFDIDVLARGAGE